MQWSLRWNANRCRLLTWYRTFLIPRMQQLFFWSLSRFSWGSRYNCALRSTHICVSQKLLPSPLRSYLAKYAHSTQRISLGLSMTCDKIWVLAATCHPSFRSQTAVSWNLCFRPLFNPNNWCRWTFLSIDIRFRLCLWKRSLHSQTISWLTLPSQVSHWYWSTSISCSAIAHYTSWRGERIVEDETVKHNLRILALFSVLVWLTMLQRRMISPSIQIDEIAVQSWIRQ